MATFTLEQYRKVWNTRLRTLNKNFKTTPNAGAKILAANARRLAPRRTGALLQSIKQRKNTVTVGGLRNQGFPYVMWIEQRAPYRSVRMRWNEGKPTIYGDGSHVRTGTPRFFHFATLRARKKFPLMVRKAFRDSMKVTV